MNDLQKKLIFLDVESTGLESDARLVQIAFKFDNSQYYNLFNPEIKISKDATAVHKISNKDVKDKILFRDSEDYKVLKSILPENILVAHNAFFDINVLKNEGLLVNKFICTLRICYTLYDLPEYKLKFLLETFDLLKNFESKDQDYHDALFDITILEKLFNHLIKEIDIEKMVEISSKPALIKRVPFGKYRGDLFNQVVKNDRNYLSWMSGLDNLSEDLEYTLNYYLNK